MTDHELSALCRGMRVLITGGLGFIGSTLARELVEAGIEVTIVDSLVPEYGGSLENIPEIADDVRVNISDVRDQHSLHVLVQEQDVLFNLAEQTSHVDSMTDPYTDLEINCRSQLSVLEACRHRNPDVGIIFASTRQIYGEPRYLPVNESHPIVPVDVNGINKIAGEWYHLLYGQVYGLRVAALRLTNTYGRGCASRTPVRRSSATGCASSWRAAAFPSSVKVSSATSPTSTARLALSSSPACRTGQTTASLTSAATRSCRCARSQSCSSTLPAGGVQRRSVSVRTASNRHRRLLRAYPRDPCVGAPCHARGRPCPLGRLLPRAGSGLLGRRVTVPFLDLRRETEVFRQEFDAAVSAVLDEGRFVLGPAVTQFENAFAEWCGAGHEVGVASGTDAITIWLQALGIGLGHEVVTVANSCVPTVAGIEATGANPLLVDPVESTQTIDVGLVVEALTERARAIGPVHLYGRCAEWPRRSSWHVLTGSRWSRMRHRPTVPRVQAAGSARWRTPLPPASPPPRT